MYIYVYTLSVDRQDWFAFVRAFSLFFSHSFVPYRAHHRRSFFSPHVGRKKSLFLSREKDRIKIAGAISRTHDIGENAAEALIMADTRRGSRYHVLYPLNSNTLITLMSRQSRTLRRLHTPLPPSPPLTPIPCTFFPNRSNQNHANRCKNRVMLKHAAWPGSAVHRASLRRRTHRSLFHTCTNAQGHCSNSVM